MRKLLTYLLYIEALILLAIALYMTSLGFTHDKEWAPFLGVIAFLTAGTVGLFFLARGVRNGRRWANAPSMLANLISLGVAKYQFEAKIYFLAFPLFLISLSVIILVFTAVKTSSID